MRDFYNSNTDFHRYVDRECQKNNCTVNLCLRFSWVKAAYEYYKNMENGNNDPSSSDWYAGCGCVVAEDKSC